MFRKLQDRLGTAAASVWNAWSETDMQRLQSLGFSADQAQSAMEACNGNVDQAANLLIAENASSEHHATRSASDIEDRQLRQAMEASMQVHQEVRRPQRTAAMNKAAEAAFRRNEHNSKKKYMPGAQSSNAAVIVNESASSFIIPSRAEILRDHHPEVKLIPKLQDKSTEEQILRTADRLRSFPAAVDILYKVLSSLRDDPTNPQFQRLSCQTAGYQRNIQPAVGAEDFLKAMKFFKGDNQFWILHISDPALLYLGISALEQTMQTKEYIETKKDLAFEKELASYLNATVTAEEQSARSAHLRRCPKEPKSGALITIEMAPQTKIQRRFDGDDTVGDMLHWMASAVGTAIFEKVVTTREWCLTDRNQKTIVPLDTSKQHLTLQYVGCWPSGRLFLTHT